MRPHHRAVPGRDRLRPPPRQVQNEFGSVDALVRQRDRARPPRNRRETALQLAGSSGCSSSDAYSAGACSARRCSRDARRSTMALAFLGFCAFGVVTLRQLIVEPALLSPLMRVVGVSVPLWVLAIFTVVRVMFMKSGDLVELTFSFPLTNRARDARRSCCSRRCSWASGSPHARRAGHRDASDRRRRHPRRRHHLPGHAERSTPTC